MRKATWLLTALLAAAAAAGCGDDERSAGRRLAKEVDLARRLYGRAVALLADPTYVDSVTGLTYATAETVLLKSGGRYTGAVTLTDQGYRIQGRAGMTHNESAGKVKTVTSYETPSEEIVPPTKAGDAPPGPSAAQVARGREAMDLLKKARGIVAVALNKNRNASAGAKADAQLLLGQIEVAAGQYHCTQAERARGQANRLRWISQSLLDSATDSAILGEFNRALADMPQDKVAQLREAALTEAQALSAKVTAAGAKVQGLRQEMQTLAQEIAQLRSQATKLRDRSDQESGQESYRLLTEAHKVERQINLKAGRAAAAQDGMGTLTGDIYLQQRQLRALREKLKALDGQLAKINDHRARATQAMRQAVSEATKQFDQAVVAAGDAAKICGKLMAQEKLALEAMDSAAKHLAQARSSIRSERDAASKTRQRQGATSAILDELADDKHFASSAALLASASLAVADVLGGQLGTAGGNAALAEGLTKVAGKLSQPTPAAAAQLKAYLSDQPATRRRAVEKYESAEKALEGILRNQLKTGTGRNIRWIYQAQLADAYYGHFRLTGQMDVRLKGQNLVNEALAGKEGSPYLGSVLNLKALLDRAESPKPL